MVVKNKKGQALIETLFLLPFIVAVIMLAYQAYVLINKNIVSQKYLKGVVVGRLLNRNEISVHDVANPPSITDGKYFYRFRESSGFNLMSYDVDKATAELITLFLTDTQKKEALIERLTERNTGNSSLNALGVCIGGVTLTGEQTSPDVFDLSEGDTCGKK
ncbi:MAG TPA: hypothetical protein PK443_05710 [bacterium]|nr:hypothetical protein [bacterium]